MTSLSPQKVERRPLGDVCTLQRGFDLPVKDRKPGNYPLVTSSGPTDFHSEARVPGPGVVTGRSGSIGNVFYVEDSFWPLNTALYVKDFHGNDPRYVFYLLQFFDLGRFASGAGVPTLNRNHVHDEAVWIATDPAEQKRIVAVLDHAFAALDRARALTEANLADAEALFQQTVDSVLAERPDWPQRSLGQLGKTQTGGTPKGSEKGHYGEHIPFIKPGDFAQDGSLDYHNEGLSEHGALSARRVPAGSALMVCIGATIGKAGYCEQDVTTNQQINSLTPHANVDGRFVYYNFIRSDFQRAVFAKSGQATLPIINKSKWSELTIGVPVDVSVQREIAHRLSTLRLSVDRAADAYEMKLSEVGSLRQSLLQKAFAGELT